MEHQREQSGGDLGEAHASVAWSAAAVAASVATLSGCGGGGGDAGKAPTSAPTDDPQVLAGATTLLPEEDAARFLGQAALSAPMAEVTRLVNAGLNYNAWLDEQFAKPARTDTASALNGRTAYQLALDQGVLALDASGQNYAHIGGDFGLDSALWFRLITADDVLRQRIVLALSEIFVVSQRNMPIPWGPHGLPGVLGPSGAPLLWHLPRAHRGHHPVAGHGHLPQPARQQEGRCGRTPP